ncbi:hypothetical protein, partial [Vibrio fluvialis]|uniref:hypothetical protein n=1 Tax=Vibrio fluvialis TaxID=676 RepID=UPI001EEBA750
SASGTPKTVPVSECEAKGTFWILFVPAKSIWCALTKWRLYAELKAQHTDKISLVAVFNTQNIPFFSNVCIRFKTSLKAY